MAEWGNTQYIAKWLVLIIRDMYIDDSSYKLEQSRGKIAFDVRFGKGKMKNEKGEWRA